MSANVSGEERTDLLVIGAGPAGMSAAIAARRYGLRVIVVDENEASGGQIYRAIEANAARPRRLALLGADYAGGRTLASAFAASGAEHRPSSTAFEVGPDASASVITAGRGAYVIRSSAILLASGAYERPFPVPGWTLPGVMTAGAAQTLLKRSGQVPLGRIVLAGGGPLLWLVAAQLRAAGAGVGAVLSFTPPSGYLRQWRALAAAWRSHGDLVKGARWIAGAHLAGARVVHGARIVSIEARGSRRVVRYAHRGGEQEESGDVVLLHAGVVPNTQATRLLDIEHVWDDALACWRPRVDAWGASSHSSILVAGDGAGIGGARVAAITGELAALGLARRLQRITATERDALAAPLQAALARERPLRELLDATGAPPAWLRVPPDDETIVCRCERVTARQVRDAVALGATGPNQVKAFVRAGMGACQGRMCASTVAEVVAHARGASPADLAPQRVRPPLKPLHIADLAAMRLDEASADRSLHTISPGMQATDRTASDATRSH